MVGLENLEQIAKEFHRAAPGSRQRLENRGVDYDALVQTAYRNNPDATFEEVVQFVSGFEYGMVVVLRGLVDGD